MMKKLPILAKDRHYLHRLRQEIKHAQGDDKAKKQAKFNEVTNLSNQAVIARQNAMPSHLPELLNHDLPVTKEAQTLIKAIEDHQVIIVAGETGSGKTTQLPKLAMLAGRG